MTPGRRAVTVAAVVLLTMVFALTHRGGSDQPVGSGSTHSADRTDLAPLAARAHALASGREDIGTAAPGDNPDAKARAAREL